MDISNEIDKFNSFIKDTWIPDIKKRFPHGNDTTEKTCETGDSVITFSYKQSTDSPLLILSIWDLF